MPRWALTLAGALAAAALYVFMAVVVADVPVGNAIVGSILFAGVGALVTAAFVVGRSRRRQPRV